jgi:hypothetical protein
MATDTRIRIRRNPYHGFEVWLWGNGELTRRSFDNSIDLASKLAADCVSDQDIEDACDMFERLEWAEPEYPLGVVYVGEAVCDFGEPAYDPRTVAFRRPVEPSPYWEWAAATLRIGAVTAPWVIVMLAGRVVWGWL